MESVTICKCLVTLHEPELGAIPPEFTRVDLLYKLSYITIMALRSWSQSLPMIYTYSACISYAMSVARPHVQTSANSLSQVFTLSIVHVAKDRDTHINRKS